MASEKPGASLRAPDHSHPHSASALLGRVLRPAVGRSTRPDMKGLFLDHDLGKYGTLSMRSLANPDTGTVRYWLTAPHVRGSVVLVPAVLFDDPTEPDLRSVDLYVFAQLDNARDERPLSVNGIELKGRSAADSAQPHTIEPWRENGAGNPDLLPQASRFRARAVLGAVVAHWSHRSDRKQLEDIARSSSAQHFLEQYEAKLDRRRETVRRAQAELQETERRIRDLRDLVAPAAVRA